MAGLASAFGGVGEAAGQYGQQIRGILEQRRGHMVDLLSNMAQQEIDPQKKAEIYDHMSRLLAGEDMAKVFKSGIPMLQKHAESNDAHAQIPGMLGLDQKPPATRPAPAGPGQTPGTTTTPVSAAQPSMSPVQPQAQPQTGIQPVQAQPQQATAQQIAPDLNAALQAPPQHQFAPPPAPGPAPMIPGLPPGVSQPRGAQAILESYRNHPLMQTSAGRTMLQPIINQEILHDQALREKLEEQQTTLAYRHQAVGNMDLSKLPPVVAAGYRAQEGGLTPVNMPMGALVPTKYQSRAEELDPNVLAQFNLTGYKGPVTISKSRMDGSIVDIVPGNEGMGLITNPDGTQSWTPKKEGAAGVARSQVAPHMVTGPDGSLQARTAGEINKGNFINPQFSPVTTSSVQHVPGQEDQTTVSTRQRGTPLSTPTTTRAGGTSSGVPPVSGGGDMIANNYKAWAAGGPAPTGKALEAAVTYATKTGQPIPTQLSAAGQKDLATVGDVLNQIKRIKTQMESLKLDKDTGNSTYIDYLRAQRLGQATPLGGLWTDLSFEGFRSGGAAMKGISARGQQILAKAMEHVPRPTAELNPMSHEILHAPDTPARMYQKLNEMQKILTDSLNEVMKDERKGGTIPAVQGGGKGDLKGLSDEELMKRIVGGGK